MADTLQSTAAPCFYPAPPNDEIYLRSASLRLLQSVMRAQLPGHLKLLLNTLCMHHNDKIGCAWPSVERLATLCATSRRTIQRQLGLLVASKLLIIGRIPGIKSNAYAVQELPLLAIAIQGIKMAKNALGHEAHLLQPTVVFGVTNPSAGATLQAPKGDIGTPKGDTHVTLTEGNGIELKKTEAGRQAPAPTVKAVPAAPPPAAPQPSPAPVLASLALDCPALQTAINAVNQQRLNNGKKAMLHTDIKRLTQEATLANISLVQALDWILERPTRNFFRADFYQPTSAPHNGFLNAAPATPIKPPEPPAPPTPAQIAARQARAQQQALEEQASKATAAVWMEKLRHHQAQASAARPQPPLWVSGILLSGPDWAMSAVRDFQAGQRVNLFRMETACAALGISCQTLRNAQAITSEF